MRNAQKTIFISYRRANAPWAIAISQYLTHKGFDVFIDSNSINSGDFEQIITESIYARAHFLVLLTPSAIEDRNKPEDWLRKEIEIALDSQRNIIPVLLEGFDFYAPETKEFLTGKLDYLQKYNALKLYADYFDAGMDRLCDQFLDVVLEDVHHPLLEEVSEKTKRIVEESQREIAEQPPVEEKVLSAQEWFGKAYAATSPMEQIRLYTKAIELNPEFAYAYNNRGNSYDDLGQTEKAIEDYNKAIQLDPENAAAYNNRGNSYNNLGQYEKAIKDLNKAIQLDPKYAFAYNNRGNSYAKSGLYEKAINDYNKAIQLDPDYGSPYYNRACLYALQGNIDDACIWLAQSFERKLEYFCKLVKTDPDFDSIRDDERFKKLIAEYCSDC